MKTSLSVAVMLFHFHLEGSQTPQTDFRVLLNDPVRLQSNCAVARATLFCLSEKRRTRFKTTRGKLPITSAPISITTVIGFPASGVPR